MQAAAQFEPASLSRVPQTAPHVGTLQQRHAFPGDSVAAAADLHPAAPAGWRDGRGKTCTRLQLGSVDAPMMMCHSA